MPDGTQGPEIRKPLILFGAGATFALLFSACGTPPEAIASAAQSNIDALENKPHVEVIAAASTEESVSEPNVAEAGDSIWGMVAENFDVTGDELKLFINFGTFWRGERGGSMVPIAWFSTKTALEMSGGIPGMLPKLWVGDEVISGKTDDVEDFVNENGFRGDRGMMVIRSDQVKNEDGSIENQVHVEGGEYGSGVTFRFGLDGHPEDNVWEVEVSDGEWVPAETITRIMRERGLSFYDAKQAYQTEQSANN